MSSDALARARSAHTDRRWATAFAAFADAERAAPLHPRDLDHMAECAHLLHRMDEYFAARELAYQRHLDRGDDAAAALSSFWIAAQHLHDGEVAHGTGWLQRLERLASEADDERLTGYLSLARSFPAVAGGDLDAAASLTTAAARAARESADTDLAALALHQAGLVRLAAGRVQEGCALLDEAMVVVTADRASSMVTGIVYCGVISGCWEIYDVGRAREWTDAMSGWCATQPEMTGFVGECRVRRAELLQLVGDWDRADTLLVGLDDDVDRTSAALAACVRGDLARLQGRWEDADAAYAAAARDGWEPQPGLALLRLARGSTQAAAAMVRRALAESSTVARRVPLLAAGVEVLLAVGDETRAHALAEELTALGERQDSDLVRAVAAQAQARLSLSAGRPEDAGAAARRALATWVRVAAPYEEARTRTLVAAAWHALGDHESADRERATAREIFTSLGAQPDLEALDRRAREVLTAREVEVLRLVATGATNRAIAERLVLSERTVDRHVSNILTKLDVSSRAAAAARAASWQLL
ncbi:LuxR C-terminal-related transcriptional regulator [Georgenia phoenicis]|uniref:helix-turn-helix transcriptional regulator n=1 Tax=unclassified Georgenia TaxID=2626815 RepID=UPI0039B05D2A